MRKFWLFQTAPEGLSRRRQALFWLWNGGVLLLAGLCLGVLSLFFAYGDYPDTLMRTYFRHPLIVCLNIAPVLLALLLAYGLFGRPWPAFLAADLVVCRAGAATISELTALGGPALIVRSPYVTNNHQEKNARALEEAGGAAVLLEKDSSGQALFQAACGILHDKERRTGMEKAMASLGIRDAAERIYQTVLEIRK